MKNLSTKQFIKIGKYTIIVVDLLLLIPLYGLINENIISSYIETPESLTNNFTNSSKSLNPNKLDEAIKAYNDKKNNTEILYLEDIFN